jgi:hydrogenase maturation protease
MSLPTERRVLIAGAGNIFFGDDAFGSEVARELLRQEPIPGATIIDFGIRAQDLAYTIADGAFDAIILVDATARGGLPGTLYLIEPVVDEVQDGNEGDLVNAHGMNPVRALQMIRALGGHCEKLYVVACEPEVLETEALGLSEVVQAAVPPALEMIRSLAHDLVQRGEPALQNSHAGIN